MSIILVILLMYFILGIGLVCGILLTGWNFYMRGIVPEEDWNDAIRPKEILKGMMQTIIWPYYVIMVLVYTADERNKVIKDEL